MPGRHHRHSLRRLTPTSVRGRRCPAACRARHRGGPGRPVRILAWTIFTGQWRITNPRASRKVQERWRRTRAPVEVTRTPPAPSSTCLEMLRLSLRPCARGARPHYMIVDVVARMKRMRGFNVLHRLAGRLRLRRERRDQERHAPRTWTFENIAHMKGQLQRIASATPGSASSPHLAPEYYRLEPSGSF